MDKNFIFKRRIISAALAAALIIGCIAADKYQITGDGVSPSDAGVPSVTDESVSNISDIEESSTEESSTGESSAEESSTEESSTEESSTGESSAEESSTEESSTEESSTGESSAEESSTEESSTEESSTQESSTGELSTEESSTQESSTQESSTEESSTQESSTQESSTEESSDEPGDLYAGKFEYEFDGDQAIITKCLEKKRTVTVPEMIGGKSVTRIAEGAFSGNKRLFSVSLPSTLQEIGEGAFESCISLKDITIPGNTAVVGRRAFADCRSLESAVFCDGVQRICERVFDGCHRLTEISVPDSVRYIAADSDGAFDNTAWYESKPDGLIYTGKILYRYKGAMRRNATLTIREGTVAIADGAFRDSLYKLRAIYLPDSLSVIGDRAFLNCRILKIIRFGSESELAVIGERAFEGCHKLESASFPGSVKVIGERAFYNCRKLCDIGLGNDMAEVGQEAFLGCISLKSVIVTGKDQIIGAHAFGFEKTSPEQRVSDFMLCGDKGSQIQRFARRNGLRFLSVDKEVTLDKSAATVGVGEEFDLTASFASRWYSSDESVAEVSDGRVIPVGEGRTVITAKAINGRTAECIVDVRPAPDYVELNKSELELGEGQTARLLCSISSGSLSSVRVFESSDEDVVRITSSTLGRCNIKAVGAGTSTVTVTTHNGKTASCIVTVLPAPESVSFTEDSVTLGVGETYRLKADVNSGAFSGTMSYYSTGSASIVKVLTSDEDGCIIQAGAVGTSFIRAVTYNGKTSLCKVTVKPAPTVIYMNSPVTTVGAGEVFDLKTTINSTEESNTLTYSSSNANVVKVRESTTEGCTVKAVNPGYAIITVTTHNGVSATCGITVMDAPENITLDQSIVTLRTGQIYTLVSEVNGGAAASKRVYTSTHSSIAKIISSTSDTCTVKAVSKGTTVIKVRTYNGKMAACTIRVTE